MGKISKLLSSLLVGVDTGALDESWLPHINDAMNELRDLESAQPTLVPDICSACNGTGIDFSDNDLYCEFCGGMGWSYAGKA